MEQQNQRPSIEEVKDALKTISKYCRSVTSEDCAKKCEIHELLGGCPICVFIPAPEDWKID